MLQTNEVSIRWYSDKKSLNVDGVGEIAERIKSALLSMAKTTNDVEPNVEIESLDESDEVNAYVLTLSDTTL